MIKIFRIVNPVPILVLLPRRYLSVVSPFTNMVRFFPNPYEDPKNKIIINKDEITNEIDDRIKNIIKKLPPTSKNVDGGLYVGVTGVAFMFYYLAKNPMLSANKSVYLEKAHDYLKPALETSAGEKTSFLLGDAGTYALAAVIKKEIADDQFKEFVQSYKSLYKLYLNPKFLKCGGDEFFVGRSGYLAGALWMTRELKTQIFKNEELYSICDFIVSSGKDFSKRNQSPCPLMYHYYNTQYLGAAHGLSFILQTLLSVPGYLDYNKPAAQDIEMTVQYLASIQTEEGNWPCCLEEIAMADHKLIHWCHGAPGMIYLMAKAYLVFKDQIYIQSCIRAGEVVWNKGLLRKGPGICHGVAGNGYVFLLLFRLTGDEKYLSRAKLFADFMNGSDFLRDARLPDNPQSLYEGTAGTVCYLADLLLPEKAEFPFQDVFSTYDNISTLNSSQM